MGQPVDSGERDRSAAGRSADSPLWRLLVSQLTGRRRPAPGVPEERRLPPDRRTHSLRSFVYGGLRPRRRVGRRDGDHDRIFLDWHEPRVLYMVLGIILMSCADALFTLNLLAVGAEELNAVMGMLIGMDVAHFLYIKIGITAISVVLLGVAARRQFMGIVPVIRLLQFFCAGYAVLILYEAWLLGTYLTELHIPWQPWGDLTIG